MQSIHLNDEPILYNNQSSTPALSFCKCLKKFVNLRVQRSEVCVNNLMRAAIS